VVAHHLALARQAYPTRTKMEKMVQRTLGQAEAARIETDLATKMVVAEAPDTF